jgi:peroxiredoxin
MQFKSGDRVTNIILPAIDGSMFSLENLTGKRFMLSFLRFASCPFCNLRIHQLISRFHEFGENFTIVAIFDSSLKNLQKHANKHQAPFPILADENNTFYRKYGIEHSIFGLFKGMFNRFSTLVYAMFRKGYLPIGIKGSLTTMPADFLVDENGIIYIAHYGEDEGDHLPFEKIYEFTKSSSKTSGDQAIKKYDLQLQINTDNFVS